MKKIPKFMYFHKKSMKHVSDNRPGYSKLVDFVLFMIHEPKPNIKIL